MLAHTHPVAYNALPADGREDQEEPVISAAHAVVRVALIGYGAVGGPVARMIREGLAGRASVIAVVVVHPERYAAEAAALGIPFTSRTEDVIGLQPDIVLEAGGHAAFRQHVPALLAAGINVISISVGALADPHLLEETQAAAVQGGGRLRIPSGAIAALDAISSAAVGRIDRVIHTVRKPPTTLLDGEEGLAVLRSGVEKILYEGPAREATQRFPANVNVIAAVSLAGIGMDRTEARVIADPAVVHNTHDVEVEGDFGRLRLRIENVPSDENPKTGRIVALSLVRSLRALSEPIVVGG